MTKKILKITIPVLVIIIIIVSLAVWRQNTKFPAISLPETEVFPTEEICQVRTGGECDFQTCDYVPKGKTVEEVCGSNFRKGWMRI